MVVMVLFIIASCTKKSVPTAVVNGSTVFAQNCSRCHGATGTGARGPDLTKIDYGKSEVTEAIFNGGGRMPTFGDKLSTKEINAVADFVLHLNNK